MRSPHCGETASCLDHGTHPRLFHNCWQLAYSACSFEIREELRIAILPAERQPTRSLLTLISRVYKAWLPCHLFPAKVRTQMISHMAQIHGLFLISRRLMHQIIDITVHRSCMDIPILMHGVLPSMHLNCRDPCTFLLPPKPGPVDGL